MEPNFSPETTPATYIDPFGPEGSTYTVTLEERKQAIAQALADAEERIERQRWADQAFDTLKSAGFTTFEVEVDRDHGCWEYPSEPVIKRFSLQTVAGELVELFGRKARRVAGLIAAYDNSGDKSRRIDLRYLEPLEARLRGEA